ncbi:MAG: hypothetical protein AAF654_02035 [Myxococcota bacterium]
MIRIGPAGTRRVFTAKEVAELVPVLTRISRRAALRAMKRAHRYGPLRESEPEWAVLKHEMRAVIHDWSEQIRRLGAEPMELWTVGLRTEQGTEYWRYEPDEDAQLKHHVEHAV